MKVSIKTLFIGLSSILLWASCSSDSSETEEFNINIRMKNDPGKINPLVGNPTVESTEINSLIFLPLAHYDPENFELSPILIKEVPKGRSLENGGVAYDFEILPDAVWDNGSPITSKDYLFTMKVAMNPNVDAAAWRGLLSTIDSVKIDTSNDRKFAVIFNEYFHLAKESSCTFEIFPQYVYDSTGVLDQYTLAEISNSDSTDTALIEFAKDFSSIEFTQNRISGAGPYRVKVWEVDQYIVLESKENYWGKKYPERTLLRSNPSTITFRMIEDENAAVTLLKDGSIDLLLVKDAIVFENLRKSEQFDSMFTLATPPVARFLYIGLNNRVPELADKDVRRALAHLIDVDKIIENLEGGYAERQVGTIMPNSIYYNSKLKPIQYDPDKAIAILENEGWKDSNNNGVRDKVVNGDLVELEVDYLASQSPLGQKVGLLFQDNAKKAGVDINMQIKEGRSLLDAIYSHNYESSASAAGFSLAPYDPYQRWHSDNSAVKKGNTAGYVNERNDELINIIRTSKDQEERKKAYLEFQELMYEEQPIIFLYSPTQKFVLQKKYIGLFSMKRPGYFPGSFELAMAK